MAANIDRTQYWKLRKIYRVLKDDSVSQKVVVVAFVLVNKVKAFCKSLSILLQYFKTIMV